VVLTAALVSYRLGGTDGVSVEAAKWGRALAGLGFVVRRVAGELNGPAHGSDVSLPWLALDPRSSAAAPHPQELTGAVDDAALLVVANVCSLPLNPPAAAAVAGVAARFTGRVVFHHHDLPWQRPNAGGHGLPPRQRGALHVTINDLSRLELASRGIDAVTIGNVFDVDAPPGDRVGTRHTFGFTERDVVVLQPTRAIPRKNVPAALAFAEALAGMLPDVAVRYWLTGPAEDGYGPTLETLLAGARVPVTLGLAPSPADAYAASDAVVFPSTWEGFGNPVVESAIARRPLAVGHYPVLDEILALGFRFFSVNNPAAVAACLRRPDPVPLDANLAVARRHCSEASLPGRLQAAFATMGWSDW
jgi:mannosylglucosylglycerate synthase